VVIDFDTSALPRGVVGWNGLLGAIEAAHPGDENQWIEFKANVDPATVEGRFTVAKAIVAFANRDPLTADKWMGGHAVIVIGLEPGNLTGTPDIDPADLHDKINALLAPPAPGWDATPVIYRDKHVLVITVDPPRQGHPIAVIGKSSGDAVDGQVFVRKVGKSARATSADIRRLSARLLSSGRSIDGITIRAEEHSQIAAVDYPRSWLDDWLYAEETRLLAPLNPPPTRPMTAAERRLSGLTDSVLADISKQADQARRIMEMSGSVTHEENRTEDDFREQVGAYLDECRTNLAEAFKDLRQSRAYGLNLEITNTTGTNYEQVLVGLHIEGDVYGYEDEGYFSNLAEYLPRPPRKWGPWTTNPLLKAMQTSHMASLLPTISPSLGAMAPRGPSPTIINGGSVDVTCLPVHLYPKSTTHLLSIWLVGDVPLGDSVQVTWTATATNIDGRLDGDFKIPVAPDSIDLSEELQHSDGD
jgi:hypothetical protein